MSTATRQDYATAAAAALFSDEDGNRTYELGGAAYDVTGLAEIITDVGASSAWKTSGSPAWTPPSGRPTVTASAAGQAGWSAISAMRRVDDDRFDRANEPTW